MRVMDLHVEPTARDAWDFFFDFFAEVERLGKEVIVEGGWAVAAHGSPVASIDIDVIVGEEDYEDRNFYDLLHAEGAYARPESPARVDWSFATFNRLWGSRSGYDRAALLSGRTTKAIVRAPDGREVVLAIPMVPALLVMKLKAFRDRDLQFRVMRDPVEIASRDPHEIRVVHPDEGYRLRKAAKDLVDVGFLWALPANDPAEVRRLLESFGIRKAILEALAACEPRVLDAAEYLIGRHRLPFSARPVLRVVMDALA